MRQLSNILDGKLDTYPEITIRIAMKPGPGSRSSIASPD
jgi:hypothetical protein